VLVKDIRRKNLIKEIEKQQQKVYRERIMTTETSDGIGMIPGLENL